MSKGGRRANVTSREIERRLRADGWYEVAQSGSHKQFRHPAKQGRVTLIANRKTFDHGTLRSMERQAGIRLR